ncbi:hypothetical protein CMI47_12155 [Candidatus Pacearchaeota archaeon]|nr:hypothetical protein [Candidatus Pacearchaeota archaeon]
MGYEIIVKARGKDPVPSDLMADKCFQDYSWYPHSTIELIEVCDFVVNFGSTVIKECILQHKPVVNFESKPYKHFEFMFQHEYCKELNFKVEYEGFKNAVEEVMNCPKEIYDVAIKKYLFEKSGTCARILDYLEST